MRNDVEKLINKPDDIYEFLAEYMEQFDSDWKNKIEPATEEEIAKLESVCGLREQGYQIPEEYLKFLRRMGRNDGGLLSDSYYVYKNINDIIDYYENYGEEVYECDIEKNQLITFIGIETGEAGFFIDLKEDGSHDVRSSSDVLYHKDSYAGSFDKFLVQTAFMLYEKKRYKHKISFNSSWNDIKDLVQQYSDKILMKLVCDIAEKYGFKTAWFSDEWHYCGFKEKSYLFVHRNFAYYGYVVSDNMGEVGNIVDEINAVLNTHIDEDD